MAKKTKYEYDLDMPTDCFACNNSLKEGQDVIVEDGEIYCMPCAYDAGLLEEKEVMDRGE